MKNHRVFAFLLGAILFASFAHAENFEPYYGEKLHQMMQGQKATSDQKALVQELKNVMRLVHSIRQGQMDIISDSCQTEKCVQHKAIGYNNARKVLLGDMYLLEKNGQYGVFDFYCEHDYLQSEFPSGNGPAPGQIPDHRVVNIEHTWPQSRFNGRFSKEEQKSDLHHLYPTDSQMNSVRGNFEFGEVAKDSKNLKCPTVRIGQPAADHNQAGPVFEPPEDHKGRVARALFYFSVKYDLPISRGEEMTLRAWHQTHPVDEFEKERNRKVFEIQGSRNPFVDYPELANSIQDF